MTSRPAEVITALGLTAGDAHLAAGITYRQLDHWARQGWVTPSLDPGTGRSGRRRYSVEDVVRLDLLRHLARSRVNTAVAGPLVGGVDVAGRHDAVVIYGPVGDGAAITVTARGELARHVTAPGAWIVYDPARLLKQLSSSSAAIAERKEVSA